MEVRALLVPLSDVHPWCSGNIPPSHDGDAGSSPAGCSVGDRACGVNGSTSACQVGGAGSTPARRSWLSFEFGCLQLRVGSVPPCCSGSRPPSQRGSVGSIPTGGSCKMRSAECGIEKRRVVMNSALRTPQWIRLVGLVAKTPECQPGNRGSIPRRAAVGAWPVRLADRHLVLNLTAGVRFPHGLLGSDE